MWKYLQKIAFFRVNKDRPKQRELLVKKNNKEFKTALKVYPRLSLM